jgi:hypothetical protein
MPLILAPGDYTRWLSGEPDPRDLMRPYSAGPMRMWPISTHVTKPQNDDPSIIEPIALPVQRRSGSRGSRRPISRFPAGLHLFFESHWRETPQFPCCLELQ